MSEAAFHPIGIPGQPWGDAEKAQWRDRQGRRRSYAADVVAAIDALRDRFDIVEYGRLEYGADAYPLLAVRSREWRDDLPTILVTGGVHGYETSGVHGALQFIEQHGDAYAGRINLLVLPCVSPWAYERIHRWNPLAIDPNRSFRGAGESEEAAAVIRLLAPLRDRILVHIDLHETTDSDETEFRPALAARDGNPSEPGEIPDVRRYWMPATSPAPAIPAIAPLTRAEPSSVRPTSIPAKRAPWRLRPTARNRSPAGVRPTT